MEKNTEDLIAVGAAVGTNCQPCLKYLVEKARKNGAVEEDIAEAVRVDGRIRESAARKMDGFADAFLSGRAAAPDKTLEGCGCG